MAGRISYLGGIVKDGLILDLDAAKIQSYPRTGTLWNDISGNGYTGTLINGPTFNSGNGGSIVFDGTNDYVANNSYKPFTIGSMTYEIIFKANNNPSNGPLGTSDISGTVPYFYLDYGSGNLKTYNSTSSPQYFTVQSLSVGVIYHFICTRNGTTESNYINGLSVLGRTVGLGGTSDGFGGLGGFTLLGWYLNCNIYLIRSYNRALTATEVLQNYNATRGRFGL